MAEPKAPLHWLKQARPLSLARRALSPRPWYLICYVTNRCNQRCNMCLYWKELNTSRAREEFTPDDYVKIARNFPDLYQLTLTGGEPTLRKDLGEIIRVFYRETGVRRVTVPTNGMVPERLVALVEEVMAACPDLTLSINFSLDGVGALQDEIRGVPGSFDKLVESHRTLTALRENHPRLFIALATVVSQTNVHGMEELFAFVRDDLKNLNHGIMTVRGDFKADSGGPIPAADYIALLKRHRALFRGQGRAADAMMESYIDSQTRTLEERAMADPCKAGRKLMVVSEKGEVRPCEILDPSFAEGAPDAEALGDFSFGNLTETDFDLEALLARPRSRKILKFIKDRRCWCTFECAQINNFVLNPLSYLRILSKTVSGSTP